MKRRDALKAMATLAATSALGSFARGSQGPGEDVPLPELVKGFGPYMAKVPIEVASLSPNLSMISGPGGNIAALVGPDGIVMVDSFVPSRASDLTPVVRKLGAGPITLINSHWHFDHTGGNAAMAELGARIIAHEAVRPRLSTDQFLADFQMKVPPSPAAAWPVVSLGDSATLFLNGEEIHLSHVAPAHTDGDIFIHFRKANILHTGDLFSNGIYPNIDSSSGGWIGGMIAAADRILGIVDARTKIIPGHGPIATKDDLKASRAMLAEVRDKLEPLVAAGKTVDEVVAAKPLASLDARWGKGMLRGSHFTRIVYSGLAKYRSKS
jgi:cyclase